MFLRQMTDKISQLKIELAQLEKDRELLQKWTDDNYSRAKELIDQISHKLRRAPYVENVAVGNPYLNMNSHISIEFRFRITDVYKKYPEKTIEKLQKMAQKTMGARFGVNRYSIVKLPYDRNDNPTALCELMFERIDV